MSDNEESPGVESPMSRNNDLGVEGTIQYNNQFSEHKPTGSGIVRLQTDNTNLIEPLNASPSMNKMNNHGNLQLPPSAP